MIALCGVVFTLAGCTNSVIGHPSPDLAAVQRIEEERTPLTSELALGDLTTIDYCSLIDLSLVAKGGMTAAEEPRPSFEECSITGTVNGRKATLEVGFLQKNATGDRAPEYGKRLPRELKIYRQLGRTDSCVYYLVFPDRVSLELYAFYEDGTSVSGGSDDPLCTVDTTVLDGVVTAVTEKKVAHFSFAPGSLGTIDACALLTDRDVYDHTAMPPRREQLPSKHRCRWSLSGSGSVAVWFYVDKPPEPTGSTTVETIVERPSMVRALSPGYCLVSTVVGPYAGAKHGEVEIAETYAVGYGVPIDACAIARGLASVIWPKLPRAA